MKRLISPILLLGICFIFSGKALAAATPNLASMDWSVKAQGNLAASPPSDEAVAALVAKLEGIPQNFTICSSHFANLRNSGNLSLVVSTSDGRFCDLNIIDKTSSGFNLSNLQIGHAADGAVIEDIAGNGHFELIVSTDFTGYQGAQHCVAKWPVIYAWTGTGYSDVSDQYKDYYARQLTSLQKEIAMIDAKKNMAEEGSAALSRGPSSSTITQAPSAINEDSQTQSEQMENGLSGSIGNFGAVLLQPSPVPQQLAAIRPDRFQLDCTEAEASKIERFLGIDQEAGMSDTIKWADSDDPGDREFAADIFADIGTPDAVSDLHTLSRDSNGDVAIAAKYALKQVNQGPVVHTVDQESIAADAGTPSP